MSGIIDFFFKPINANNNNTGEAYSQSLFKFPITPFLNKLPTQLFGFTPTLSPIKFTFEDSRGECTQSIQDYAWLKIPVIPANSSITVFVKQKEENYAVTGDEVFDFYEDFKAPQFNTEKWTVVREGQDYSLEGGIFTLFEGVQNLRTTIKSSLNFPLDRKIEFCHNIFYIGGNGHGCGLWTLNGSYNLWVGNGVHMLRTNVPVSTFTDFKIATFIVTNNKIIQGYYDGNYIASQNPESLDFYQIFIGNIPWGSGATNWSGVKYDWVRMSKYAEIEPDLTYYDNQIIITNPNSYPLKDYQVRIQVQEEWKNMQFLSFEMPTIIPDLGISVLNKDSFFPFAFNTSSTILNNKNLNFYLYLLIPSDEYKNASVHFKIKLVKMNSLNQPQEKNIEKIFNLNPETIPGPYILDFGIIDQIPPETIVIGHVKRVDSQDDTLDSPLPILGGEFVLEF